MAREHRLGGRFELRRLSLEVGSHPASPFGCMARQLHAVDGKHPASDQPRLVADGQDRGEDVRDVVAERADERDERHDVRRPRPAERNECHVLLTMPRVFA